MGSWPLGLGSILGAKLWASARCYWMKVPSAMVSLSSGGTAELGGDGMSRHQWGMCRTLASQWGSCTYMTSISSSPPRLGLGPPVKHDWTFQDRDAQFYRFPGPELEPTGAREVEEELVEAMALLTQRGPDALLTVALRKP
jgi:hypothetical protein